MSAGVNVNFGALKYQSEFWKSPGNLFLKKGTNPNLNANLNVARLQHESSVKVIP